MPVFILVFLVIAAIASSLLTDKVRHYLVKRSMLDIPNERSSHTQPVPRGGGLAVMPVVMGGLVVTLVYSRSAGSTLCLLLALAILIGISLYDDRKGAPVSVRLGTQFAAAAIGASLFPSDQLLLGGFVSFWFDRLIMVIGWIWFMNLYNFMDGIDGITGVETTSIAAGLIPFIMLVSPTVGDALLPLAMIALLIGSMAGFLRHNWHPAKIFLGDSGSVPLGFLIGYLLILIATKGFLAAAVILPLYYLADSGITITKRMLRGEKIWQAHRQHFYQQAARGTGRHDKVALWILACNVALIGCAVLSVLNPLIGLGLAIVTVAILLVKMHKSGNPTPAVS